MKERPILFSAPMVRAILEGKKTQTRRACKVVDACGQSFYTYGPEAMASLVRNHCPYGKPGDRLWVRENCRAEELEDGQDGVRYDSGEFVPILGTPVAAIDWLELYNYGGGSGRKVPSIHMPRWASRITLEVVSVRVERLTAISGPDCWAEGIEHAGWDCDKYGSVVHCFRDLWESINGPGSWDLNPWVWVVEFRRVHP